MCISVSIIILHTHHMCSCSYVCDDYVLNDNAASDIKILRSALSAVASQTFIGIEKKGKRILRSQSFHVLRNR